MISNTKANRTQYKKTTAILNKKTGTIRNRKPVKDTNKFPTMIPNSASSLLSDSSRTNELDQLQRRFAPRPPPPLPHMCAPHEPNKELNKKLNNTRILGNRLRTELSSRPLVKTHFSSSLLVRSITQHKQSKASDRASVPSPAASTQTPRIFRKRSVSPGAAGGTPNAPIFYARGQTLKRLGEEGGGGPTGPGGRNMVLISCVAVVLGGGGLGEKQTCPPPRRQ